MTTVQEHTKMIITILLTNHADRQHTYDFNPGDTIESAQATFMKAFADMDEALLGNEPRIVFSGPITGYRVEHIIGFQVTFQGQDEITQQIEQRSRTLGFTSPS